MWFVLKPPYNIVHLQAENVFNFLLVNLACTVIEEARLWTRYNRSDINDFPCVHIMAVCVGNCIPQNHMRVTQHKSFLQMLKCYTATCSSEVTCHFIIISLTCSWPALTFSYNRNANAGPEKFTETVSAMFGIKDKF